MTGTDVPIVWRGRRTIAFVPELLATRDLDLSNTTVGRTANARAALEHGAESIPHEYAALARLLLRAEGIASSYIEGVAAAVVDIVLAEDGHVGAGSTAGWIAANLAAVTQAIDSAGHGPLTLASLCDWHRTLMTGSPTPARHVGVIRDEQGWIGGTSPMDAHLVTPPVDYLIDLLADLVEYVNRDDIDAVAQAAIAHAQFELIHPFADGNGRVGRTLIAWILTRRLSLVTPPPVSTRIATDVGGYGAGLVQFRLGHTQHWVTWFADAVAGAGRTQRDLVAAVASLQSQWRERLSLTRVDMRRLRSDAAAWPLLELLPRHLVLTAGLVEAELHISLKSALGALDDLVAHGVLVEHAARQRSEIGRPRKLYVSEELLGLVGSNALR